jgi:hypothetical protein
MSFINIKLPAPVIADLYKNSLIQSGETRVVEPLPEKGAGDTPSGLYKFLGSNRQHIVMIVDFPAETFLPDAHLQMLTKMLDACKLNLGDVAIVNHAAMAVDMEKLKEQLQPRHVLLFGPDPVSLKLPFSFPQFKDQAHAGCTYLFTPPLDELNQDTEDGKLMKSKLWVCLRKLFNV